MTKNNSHVAPADDGDDDRSSHHTRDQDTKNRDKVAEFSAGGVPTEIPSSISVSPHSLSTERDATNTSNAPHPTGIHAAITSNHHKTNGVVISAGSSDGTSTTSTSAPPPAISATTARTGAGGRRLTFADETGGALAEVNYSNRTHYSKQTGPSALGGPGRACCVIS